MSGRFGVVGRVAGRAMIMVSFVGTICFNVDYLLFVNVMGRLHVHICW